MKKPRLETPHARARFAGVLALVALALLAVFTFRTQVLRTGGEVFVGEGNRLRALPLRAARGDILDRDSALLAGTTVNTALVLMPAPPDSVRARLRRIARLLELPRDWPARTERAVLAVSRPYVLATALRPIDVGRLAASQRELPGVLLEPWPQRVYPTGQASAAVVGRIGFEPWPHGAGENPGGAGAGRMVGRTGLELAFDSLLSGEPGVRYVEMDSEGRLITDPLNPAYREPVPGRPLHTSINSDLQGYIAGMMPASLHAGAVVIDIATGDVLALYSQPTATTDSSNAPPNAVVAIVESPRAVFHPITAALAFESGNIDLERAQTIPCRGGMRYGARYFRCWNPEGHGQLALAGAIVEACDVYFYQLSLRLGLQKLLDAGARMGLGEETGLELREERPGTYPSDVVEFARRLGRAPNPSDALDLGSGHGLNRSTLIRMTHTYAALSNGGVSPAPRLTSEFSAPPPWRLELPPERVDSLFAMLESVTAPGGPGRAAGAAMSAGMRIRGQLSRARNERGAPRATGWFVGVAGPTGGPDRIAVGVIVPRAPGNETAAALAGRIADYYLRSGGSDPAPAAPDTTTPSSTTVASL